MFHKGIIGYSGHMQDSSQEKLFFHAFMHDSFFPFITFIPSSPHFPLISSVCPSCHHSFPLQVNNSERHLPCCVLCYFVFSEACFFFKCKQAYPNAQAFLILDIIPCFVSVLTVCYEVLYLWCDKFLFLVLYWVWWLHFGQQGHQHHYYYYY